MIGRDAEAAAAAAAITAAREGRSGTLLISGEAGIGKTLLLAHARDAAADLLVLETSGVEAESRLPFAGLADLLHPVLQLIEGLPPPQAAALRGALALGPPVPGDRFTAYAAVLGVLAAAAEERPLVALVDDAHWLDAESLDALLFCARRIDAEGILLILAARPGERPTLDAAEVERLGLAGLEPQDAERLLRERAPGDPDAQTAHALVAGAAGNPLALVELATTLTPAQLAGRDPLPDPLPVGPHLRRGLLRPLRDLPARTRTALLVLAAGDASAASLAPALAAAGVGMDDLDDAVAAGVVTLAGNRVAFSHPLVRAAVHGTADGPDLRDAHRAHALAAEAAGDEDRRAWHLALAAAGPDEQAAGALEEAAGRATARTAYAAATAALTVSAELSAEPRDRSRRLLAAGNLATAGGDFPLGARLLDEAAELGEPDLVVQAMGARALVETYAGSVRRAVDMFAAAADRAERAGLTTQAIAIGLQGAIPAVMRADLSSAENALARASALPRDGTAELDALLATARADLATFSGTPTPLDDTLVAGLSAAVATGDPSAYAWLVAARTALMLMERYDEAAAGLDAIIRGARERSTPSALPWPLAVRAEVSLRMGRLDHALALAEESVRLADDTGQPGIAGYTRCTVALVTAVLGDGSRCRSLAGEALASAKKSEADSVRTYAAAALGLLELGERRLDAALQQYTSIDRDLRRRTTEFHPLISTWEHDFPETLIRLDRREEAIRELEILQGRADMSGAAWTAAAIARCQGLLAGNGDFERCFADALAIHARTPTPLERARTLLCLGERRRRARRPTDARGPLREALDIFAAAGAAPWAAWARQELVAAGGDLPDETPRPLGSLTAQELQIALAVARGSTNREAAGALLISPRTVESHLARVYEKLGVRTRAELAARMSREAAPL